MRGRVLVIVVSYLVASLAAGLAVNGMFAATVGFRELPLVLFVGVPIAFTMIAVVALVPAAAVIAYSEARSRRSPWFYLAAAVAVSLALLLFSAWLAPAGSDWGVRAVFLGYMALAGLTGSLVYWVLAGRNAGAWRLEGDETVSAGRPRTES